MRRRTYSAPATTCRANRPGAADLRRRIMSHPAGLCNAMPLAGCVCSGIRDPGEEGANDVGDWRAGNCYGHRWRRLAAGRRGSKPKINRGRTTQTFFEHPILQHQLSRQGLQLIVLPARTTNLLAVGLTRRITHQPFLIPVPSDHHPWAHSRVPMEMIFQGWSMSWFQA